VDGDDQVWIVEGDHDPAPFTPDEPTVARITVQIEVFSIEFTTTDSASAAVPLIQRNPFLARLVNLTHP